MNAEQLDFITLMIAYVDARLGQLPGCEMPNPESAWGACDGGEYNCQKPAPVFDLDSDMYVCLRHYGVNQA